MIAPIPAATYSPTMPSGNEAPKVDAFEMASKRISTTVSGGSGNPSLLEAHLAGSLQGWQAKVGQMDQLIGNAAKAPEASEPMTEDMGQPLAGSKPIFGLMVQTFNFAMQTQLVARAATQFTGSINTLMKGQ